MTSALTLDQAVDLTRSGDIWLFRGRRAPDRAIRAVTNSPVNHVGMAVVVDDLPPLIFHAELGKKQLDVWTGAHHRGVQLHDLRDATVTWVNRYGQQAWLRQFSGDVTPEMEAALLREIARKDGTPFPATLGLAGRWLRDGGRCAVEHDDTTSVRTVDAFRRTGQFDDVTGRRDLAGRPRFVTATRNRRQEDAGGGEA